MLNGLSTQTTGRTWRRPSMPTFCTQFITDVEHTQQTGRQTHRGRQAHRQTERGTQAGRQTDQGGKAHTGATVNARFLHSIQNTCRAHESQSLFLSWCVFRSTRRCGVSARTNIFVNQHTPDGALKIAGHQSMTDLEQTNQHHTSHTHTHTHTQVLGEGGNGLLKNRNTGESVRT